MWKGVLFPKALLWGKMAGSNSPLIPLHHSLARLSKPLKLHQLKTGKDRSILCIHSSHPITFWDKKSALKEVDKWALHQELHLSKGQQQWTQQFGTDWPALWRTFKKETKSTRTAVTSFLWCLLNRSLSWNTQATCPGCHQDKGTINHLFMECPRLAKAFTPNPLTSIITPPHHLPSKAVIALWATWKTICWLHHHQINALNVDTHQVIFTTFDQEWSRLLEITSKLS